MPTDVVKEYFDKRNEELREADLRHYCAEMTKIDFGNFDSIARKHIIERLQSMESKDAVDILLLAIQGRDIVISALKERVQDITAEFHKRA